MLKVRELYQVEFADGVKDALGIDERGRLYWNGEPVVTAQKVLLSWWMNLAIVAGGLIVSTFFTLWVVPLAYTLLDDLSVVLRARIGWWTSKARRARESRKAATVAE